MKERDAETRRLLRRAIARGLEAAGQPGMRVASLGVTAVAAGFDDASLEEIRNELVYLEDKGLVARMPETVSPEVERWRVTAAGRDWLAQG